MASIGTAVAGIASAYVDRLSHWFCMVPLPAGSGAMPTEQGSAVLVDLPGGVSCSTSEFRLHQLRCCRAAEYVDHWSEFQNRPGLLWYRLSLRVFARF